MDPSASLRSHKSAVADMLRKHRYSVGSVVSQTLRLAYVPMHPADELTVSMLWGHVQSLHELSIKYWDREDREVLLQATRNVVEMIHLCDLRDRDYLMSMTSNLLFAVASNRCLDRRERSELALRGMLETKIAKWDRFFSDVTVTRRARDNLPFTSAVLMYAVGAPDSASTRLSLLEAGHLDWDVMELMKYLGRMAMLERVNLRRPSLIPDECFTYSRDRYLVWPMSRLRAELNDHEFLMACFAVSEDLFVSTCQERHNMHATSIHCAVTSSVMTLADQRPPWYSSKEKWKRKTRMRHAVMVHCLRVHGPDDNSAYSGVAHQELRIRRARMLLKLYPHGQEYVELWIRFWEDLLYNLCLRVNSEQEKDLMRQCEDKMRRAMPELSHWAFFLIAAYNIKFVPMSLVPIEVAIQHVTDCSTDPIAAHSKFNCDLLHRLGEHQYGTSYLATHVERLSAHLHRQQSDQGTLV